MMKKRISLLILLAAALLAAIPACNKIGGTPQMPDARYTTQACRISVSEQNPWFRLLVLSEGGSYTLADWNGCFRTGNYRFENNGYTLARFGTIRILKDRATKADNDPDRIVVKDANGKEHVVNCTVDKASAESFLFRTWEVNKTTLYADNGSSSSVGSADLDMLRRFNSSGRNIKDLPSYIKEHGIGKNKNNNSKEINGLSLGDVIKYMKDNGAEPGINPKLKVKTIDVAGTGEITVTYDGGTIGQGRWTDIKEDNVKIQWITDEFGKRELDDEGNPTETPMGIYVGQDGKKAYAATSFEFKTEGKKLSVTVFCELKEKK